MTIRQPTFICNCCNHVIFQDQVGFTDVVDAYDTLGRPVSVFKVICIDCLDKYDQQTTEDPFE